MLPHSIKLAVIIQLITISLLHCYSFVKIKVIDAETGKYLEKAFVSNNRTVVQTDNKGWAIINLSPKRRIVKITLPAYKMKLINCDVGGIYIVKLIPIKGKIHQIVTASIKPKPSIKRSMRTYVLSSNQIRQIPSSNPDHLLSQLPGIHISSYYGEGSLSCLQLNGSKSRQTLILLNDVPLNDPVFGGIDLSLINFGTFDQLELSPGGLSEWYGQAAAAGVLNLVSTNSLEKRMRLIFSGGSYGYFQPRIDFADFITKKWYMRICPYYKTAMNDYVYYDFFNKKQKFQNNSLHQLSTQIENSFGPYQWGRIDAFYLFSKMKKGNPGTDSNPFPTAYTEDFWHLASLRFLHPYKDNLFRSTLYLQNKKFHYCNLDGFPIDATRLISTYGTTIHNSLQIGLPRLTLGIDAKEITIDAPDITKKNLAEGAFLTNLSIKSGHLLGDISCRFDKQEGRKPVIAPGISCGYQKEEASVRLKVSRSFTYPNLSDLYWPEDNFAVGNPDLIEEFTWNFHLFFNVKLMKNACFIEAAPFVSYSNNEIKWLPGEKNGKWSPVNLNRSRTYGTNFILKGHVVKQFLRYNGNVNVCHSEVYENNSTRTAIYAPHYTTLVNAEFGTKSLFLRPQIRYRSKVFIKPGSGQTLPEKTLYDVELIIDIGHLFTALGFYNISDLKYQEHEGFPMPGREWRLSISYDLYRKWKIPFESE